MPDSFPPPTWGPPFDERDLDALLSGHLADPPRALRQVADALAALRAAPAPAELTGEAAARAEFRALAAFRASGTDAAAGTGEGDRTLVLPVSRPARAGRRQARHRSGRGARPRLSARPHRARPPGRRLGRRGGVLVAAAGAALIVAVIALTGSLPSSIRSFGDSSAAGRLSPSASASSGSQNVQGSAARDPSRTATPSHPANVTSGVPATPSATRARDLCRAFFQYFEHPRSHGWPSGEVALFQEIANLADNGVAFNVNSYCGRYVQDMFPPHGVPRVPAAQPGAVDAPVNGGPAPVMNGKPVTS
jgi:hypothetical protein